MYSGAKDATLLYIVGLKVQRRLDACPYRV